MQSVQLFFRSLLGRATGNPVAVLALITLFVSPVMGQTDEWVPIKYGKQFAISGVTVLSESDSVVELLVVHDNKKKWEGRLAIVSLADGKLPVYEPLSWNSKDPLPVDIEAVTKFCGNTEDMVGLVTSSGTNTAVRIDRKRRSVEVVGSMKVPFRGHPEEIEGFTTATVGSTCFATWATRGKNSHPSILYWGIPNRAAGVINGIDSTTLRAPWPVRPEARTVGEVAVDQNGLLYISSTSDPGDDGPFESAVYIVGMFSARDGKIFFQPFESFIRIGKFPGHKIEAMTFLDGHSGRLVLLTDDENRGSSVRVLPMFDVVSVPDVAKY